MKLWIYYSREKEYFIQPCEQETRCGAGDEKHRSLQGREVAIRAPT